MIDVIKLQNLYIYVLSIIESRITIGMRPVIKNESDSSNDTNPYANIATLGKVLMNCHLKHVICFCAK